MTARCGAQLLAADREGLAVLEQEGGRGYLLSVDQVPGASALLMYPRQGAPDAPHRHPLVHRVVTGADATDGLEVRADVGASGRSAGLTVMMHDAGRSFRIFDVTPVLPPPD